MGLYSSQRLALVVFALCAPGVLEAAASARGDAPKGPIAEGISSFDAESFGPAGEAKASAEDLLAWDCVPSYWLGYWAWAWQPCAWIDRSYVQGAIGAVASAEFSEGLESSF